MGKMQGKHKVLENFTLREVLDQYGNAELLEEIFNGCEDRLQEFQQAFNESNDYFVSYVFESGYVSMSKCISSKLKGSLLVEYIKDFLQAYHYAEEVSILSINKV